MTWTTQPRSEIASLSAIRAGAGPKVLLIHGVGLQAEAWNKQINILTNRHSVIAVDMPGHGQSALPHQECGLAGYTELIAEILDGPTLVVGHSMGAMIALDLAIRYPERVCGVAALNAIYQRSPEARAAVNARAASLDCDVVADPAAPLERWFGERASPEKEACRAWLSAASPRGYKKAYEVFAQEDGPAEKALSSLACPAMFMTGSAEPNSTPKMSQDMAALVPSGRAYIVKHAAHMMPMTHAGEVNAQLTRFAQEVFA